MTRTPLEVFVVSLLGLRTVIYPAPDLAAAKAWWSKVLGIEPYFDEPFYVGYNVGGYELGLHPDSPVGEGPVTDWGVADGDAAYADLLAEGATELRPMCDVGDGIRTGALVEPTGSIVGVIENPNFVLPDKEHSSSPGPGM